jgi:hypothetical protein
MWHRQSKKKNKNDFDLNKIPQCASSTSHFDCDKVSKCFLWGVEATKLSTNKYFFCHTMKGSHIKILKTLDITINVVPICDLGLERILGHVRLAFDSRS